MKETSVSLGNFVAITMAYAALKCQHKQTNSMMSATQFKARLILARL